MKERASIEHEYSKQLESLANKYQIKKEKRIQAFINQQAQINNALATNNSKADSSCNQANSKDSEKPGLSEADSAVSLDTVTSRSVWEAILSDTLANSDHHFNQGSKLFNSICQELKTLSTKHEQSRVKHMQFSQKLIREGDKLESDVRAAKLKYEEQCNRVDVAKTKFQRCPDDPKCVEKLKRQWHDEIVDMNHAKNLYVLSLASCNAAKHKHYTEDIPLVVSQMRSQCESVADNLKLVWIAYLNILEYTLQQTRQDKSILKHHIDKMQSSIPQPVFQNSRSIVEPPDFVFASCDLWKNDIQQVVVNDFTTVFLRNRVLKLRERYQDVLSKVDKSNKSLEGMNNLMKAYTSNPMQGDPDTVRERINEASRDAILLSTLQRKYEAQIKVIEENIQDFPEGSKLHSFKKCSFALPTGCGVCHQMMWGSTGLSCEDCSFNLHLKCEMKVPPTCSKSKNIIRTSSDCSRTTLRSSISSTQTTSTSSTSKDADEVPRLYVCLFGYNACTPDEISVQPGEIFHIMEQDSENTGWIKIEKNGSTGIVPAWICDETCKPPSNKDAISSSNSDTGGSTKSETKSQDFKYVAYDFVKSMQDELNVLVGDHVTVVEKDDGSGWTKVKKGFYQTI